jgi:hypothetical protein
MKWYNTIMAIIRRLNFFDKIERVKGDTFVLTESGGILGYITALAAAGNPNKINITRLVFRQDCSGDAKQLVKYTIAKYGAKGASSFHTLIDDAHPELLDLFLSGCGFRQCASESVWKNDNFRTYRLPLRKFRPADAKEVCELYNSNIITYFRPSLDKTEKEFRGGFVLEDSGKIVAYTGVADIADFTALDYIPYEGLLAPRVKLKKYTNNAERLENYLRKNGFECVQTQFVLVKDFYRPIKQEENILRVFNLGESALSRG